MDTIEKLIIYLEGYKAGNKGKLPKGLNKDTIKTLEELYNNYAIYKDSLLNQKVMYDIAIPGAEKMEKEYIGFLELFKD